MSNAIQSSKFVHRTHGLSLVELLIAMSLGLILTTGMISVFASNKRSSEMNTAMANIQENARFALKALSDDIMMAGYQGCLDSRRGSPQVLAMQSPIPLVGVTDAGNPKHDYSLSAATGAVVVSAEEWFPAIPGGFSPPSINKAIPGTHVLAVQFGSRIQSTLTEPINVEGIPSPLGPITTTDNLGLATGDIAIIANCDFVDIFTVSGVGAAGAGQVLSHSSPLNRNGNLNAYYGTPNNIAQTRVMRFVSHVYYIADTGLTNESGDQVRALYQQSFPYNDSANPPSQIVQGVENMRLTYGIRDQNTLSYVAPDDPLFDPRKVESIQIGLIIASWDAISEQDDTSSYVIAGQSITALKNSTDGLTHNQDRRFRRVFNTTIKVRNRRNNRILNSQNLSQI